MKTFKRRHAKTFYNPVHLHVVIGFEGNYSDDEVLDALNRAGKHYGWGWSTDGITYYWAKSYYYNKHHFYLIDMSFNFSKEIPLSKFMEAFREELISPKNFEYHDIKSVGSFNAFYSSYVRRHFAEKTHPRTKLYIYPFGLLPKVVSKDELIRKAKSIVSKYRGWTLEYTWHGIWNGITEIDYHIYSTSSDKSTGQRLLNEIFNMLKSYKLRLTDGNYTVTVNTIVGDGSKYKSFNDFAAKNRVTLLKQINEAKNQIQKHKQEFQPRQSFIYIASPSSDNPNTVLGKINSVLLSYKDIKASVEKVFTLQVDVYAPVFFAIKLYSNNSDKNTFLSAVNETASVARSSVHSLHVGNMTVNPVLETASSLYAFSSFFTKYSKMYKSYINQGLAYQRQKEQQQPAPQPAVPPKPQNVQQEAPLSTAQPAVSQPAVYGAPNVPEDGLTTKGGNLSAGTWGLIVAIGGGLALLMIMLAKRR